MTLVCTTNLTAVRDWNWAGIEFWMLLNDDDFQVSLLPIVALDIHKLESLFGSPGWRLCLGCPQCRLSAVGLHHMAIVHDHLRLFGPSFKLQVEIPRLPQFLNYIHLQNRHYVIDIKVHYLYSLVRRFELYMELFEPQLEWLKKMLMDAGYKDLRQL